MPCCMDKKLGIKLKKVFLNCPSDCILKFQDQNASGDQTIGTCESPVVNAQGL